MLRIFNKTNTVLPIENIELHENSSIDINIPYTSNLKMMEKCNLIAVIEIQETTDTEKSETSADDSESTIVKRKRKPRKINN